MVTHEFKHRDWDIVLTDGSRKSYAKACTRLGQKGYKDPEMTEFDGARAFIYRKTEGRVNVKTAVVIHPTITPEPEVKTMITVDTSKSLELAEKHIRERGYMEMARKEEPENVRTFFIKNDFGRVEYLKLVDSTVGNIYDESIELADESFRSSEDFETGE